MIDLMREIARAEAVVDIHDRDAARAGIEHGEERRKPLKGRAVAHACRDGDHGTVRETADHACKRAFHPRDRDDHGGAHDLLQPVEQAVKPRDAHVVEPQYIISEELCGQRGFLRDRDIARAACRDQDPSDTVRRAVLAEHGEPRFLIPGKLNSAGTGFEGHEFYEASSLRKFDGKYYATVKIIPAPKRYVNYVESSPRDQLQPKFRALEYAKPGDSLNYRVPVVVEVATGRVVDNREGLGWMPRANLYYYTRTSAGKRELVTVDPQTKKENVLASDLPEGYFQITPTEDRIIFSITDEGPKERPDVYEVIHPDDRHKGLGRELYAALEHGLGEMGVRGVYACIAVPDGEDERLRPDSPLFHEAMGYKLCGTFKNCGYKFGKWYTMVWMEKLIGEFTENPEPIIPYRETLKAAPTERKPLASYDNKQIRLTDRFGNVFYGEGCSFNEEWGMHVLNCEEPGIEVGLYSIFESDIVSIIEM